MQKKLFTTLSLLAACFSFSQDCSYGTTSDVTGIGENISIGSSLIYTGAADFDVPFGTTFTADRISFQILKGETDLASVDVTFRQEVAGIPGTVIQAFPALVPATQTLAYQIDESLDSYVITIELPSAVVFEKGKYFMQLSAVEGDENGAWWEITGENQTYGAFDFFRFANEPWGGTGYYNKVFQVLGTCADSGETQPDYGDACEQQNVSNNYEDGTPFITNGGVVSVADDFTVDAGSIFHLTDFTMNTLLLGGGLHNATINIRSSVSGVPGEVLHSFANKSPYYEKYNGYYPFPGSPFDVASIIINFSFAHAPVELAEGSYFIEVIPTPNSAEFITWEKTSMPGIGEFSYTSYDGGATWQTNHDYNQVFTIGGYCSTNLGTHTTEKTTLLQYAPNPVKDVLQLTTDQQIRSIALYDIEGREVSGYTVNGQSVDMQTLSSGMYLVKVVLANDLSETFKVVKM